MSSLTKSNTNISICARALYSSYLLLEVMPILIISHLLIYLRFLPRNPLKAVHLQSRMLLHWSSIIVGQKLGNIAFISNNFAAASSQQKHYVGREATKIKVFLGLFNRWPQMLADTFKNRYMGKCVRIEKILSWSIWWPNRVHGVQI